jgi:uncharacterized protein (TIGR00290 family)
MYRPKVIVSWSSGKESAWMLHVLRQRGEVDVVGLVTTVNGVACRVAMHGVRLSLLRAQAEAVRLPLWEVPLPQPCSNEVYDAAMRKVVERARADGVDAFAFGDLFLDEVRRYREDRLVGTGIAPIFPLWGEPTVQLVEAMLEAGLLATLVCVDLRVLPRAFAGRLLDCQLLRDLPTAVDPCGERGEYHTFVHAGPMFGRPIAVAQGEIVERDSFAFADLVEGPK